jgi:hypothetical protein
MRVFVNGNFGFLVSSPFSPSPLLLPLPPCLHLTPTPLFHVPTVRLLHDLSCLNIQYSRATATTTTTNNKTRFCEEFFQILRPNSGVGGGGGVLLDTAICHLGLQLGSSVARFNEIFNINCQHCFPYTRDALCLKTSVQLGLARRKLATGNKWRCLPRA